MFNQNHSMALAVLTAAATLNAGAGLTPAGAQCELAKLVASDGAEGDEFGYAVAISGDILVIGAQADDDNGVNSGSAYVFRHDPGPPGAWIEEQKLLASDGKTEDWFGCSVAIADDTIMIGARGAPCGSVYVFRYDLGPPGGWVQDQKLPGPCPPYGDLFGFSVGIAGDIAMIGAPFEDYGTFAGAAHAYRYDGSDWIETQRLQPSDSAEYDQFGASVAISGDTAVIGTSPDVPEACGWAYIFRYDPGPPEAWVEEQKLLASDGAAQDGFGWLVDISGNAALIGACGDDDNGDDSGSAYVFRYDPGPPEGWVEEQKLLASDGTAGDYFGRGGAISGDTAVLGAPCAYYTPLGPGSAYVFQYVGSSWVEEAKLQASDGIVGDQFGGSAVISGDTVVIGAFRDDDNGERSGSAYVFSLTGVDCNENGVCDGRDIGEGTSEDCQRNGVPDECDIASSTSDDDNDNGVPDECEAPIPTVSEWGIVAMALLVLTAGTIVLTGCRPKGNAGNG